VKAWKFILAALAVFVAGAATGATVANLRAKTVKKQEVVRRGLIPPSAWARFEIFRRAERRAQVTPEQRQRIDAHIRASQAKLRKLWEPLDPAAQEEFARLREQILGELTPEQRPQFELWLKEQLASKRSGEHRGAGDGKSATERKTERSGAPEAGPDR
jgi:uncharacterized membrane-anchored protein YhcB (DUF1043 family)